MTCSCTPLADMQAHEIAEGFPATAIGILADLARLERRQLITRCPDHPRNWRITDAGLRAFMEMRMEMA